MTETKSIDKNSTMGSGAYSESNTQYSRYLMDGEQTLKVTRANKTESHWGAAIFNPAKVIQGIKMTVDAVKNNEIGSIPKYPQQKGSAGGALVHPSPLTGFTCKTKALDIVLTNYRIFFIYPKWGEPFTAYNTISIIYNPEIKPTLVELNKNKNEELDELKAEAKTGDTAAKKELKRRQGRSILHTLTGGLSRKHISELRTEALRRPFGWYEPIDIEANGSKLSMKLNWNNPTYMLNHLGATTPEAMKSTMGSQFFSVKPFELTLKKMKKQDVQEIYALIRRAPQ